MSELNLIEKVQDWSRTRGIYDKSRWEVQELGAYQELGEFIDAVLKNKSKEEQATELGDVIFYLINTYTMQEDRLSLDYMEDFLEGGFKGGEPSGDTYEVCLNTFKDLSFLNLDRLARCIAYTPGECLEKAYIKVSTRTGKMAATGKFLKDSY